MLYAGRQDNDVAPGISFRAILGSALAIPFKNHDDFFSFVEMPRDRDAGANDVLMDVGLCAECFVGNEVANSFGPLGTLPSTPRRIGMCISPMFDRLLPSLPLKEKHC